MGTVSRSLTWLVECSRAMKRVIESSVHVCGGNWGWCICSDDEDGW